MKKSVLLVLAGIAVGYMASPLIDRVPVVNKLPKLG